MTECERIMKEGILPEDFLKEEVICDFLVDKNRKKLWMILFDLLVKFDEVCQKHNLTYFLYAGTLIGAVRHNGFIPWDDDIDVCMLRSDYEKLLFLKYEFEKPYFLQTHDTDSQYYQTIAKLRNSQTTAFNKITGYQGFNQGIFLDIFPLDNFVYEGAEKRYEDINRICIDLGTYSRLKNPHLDEKNKLRFREYLDRNVDPDKVYYEVNKIAKKFSDTPTDYVALLVFTLFELKRYIYFKEDFETVTYQRFCTKSFPIPIGYDRILTTLHGNYMGIPPIEERGKWHQEFFFDPDTPYEKYEKFIKFCSI